MFHYLFKLFYFYTLSISSMVTSIVSQVLGSSPTSVKNLYCLKLLLTSTPHSPHGLIVQLKTYLTTTAQINHGHINNTPAVSVPGFPPSLPRINFIFQLFFGYKLIKFIVKDIKLLTT